MTNINHQSRSNSNCAHGYFIDTEVMQVRYIYVLTTKKRSERSIDEHGQRQSTEIAEIDVTQDYELILCGLASGCALMSDGASVAVVSGVESVMVPRGACASESAGLARSGIRSTLVS